MLKGFWSRGGGTGDKALDSVVNLFMLMKSGVSVDIEQVSSFEADVLPLVWLSYVEFERDLDHKRDEGFLKAVVKIAKSLFGGKR